MRATSVLAATVMVGICRRFINFVLNVVVAATLTRLFACWAVVKVHSSAPMPLAASWPVIISLMRLTVTSSLTCGSFATASPAWSRAVCRRVCFWDAMA